MIVVKLELWPGGREDQAEEIGRTYIANVGGSQQRGDYAAAVCRRGTQDQPRELFMMAAEDPHLSAHRAEHLRVAARGRPKAARTGHVGDYPRLSYNVWRLIIRALRSAFPEEK